MPVLDISQVFVCCFSLKLCDFVNARSVSIIAFYVLIMIVWTFQNKMEFILGIF